MCCWRLGSAYCNGFHLYSLPEPGPVFPPCRGSRGRTGHGHCGATILPDSLSQETTMLTAQEALVEAHTIVSAVECTLDQAIARARQRTQDGKDIDAYQVHCERLAYRATELRAAQALLRYAELQGQHGQDDGVTGRMALAYAAEVHQTCLAEASAHLPTYGMDETWFATTLDTADVRQAVRLGMAETLVGTIGQTVLDSNGSNTIWLGDDMAEMTRQSVRDFTRQEVEPIAEWVHRQDALAPDDLITKMGQLGFFAMSIPEAYGG